jgi:hypothetical protein
MEEAWRPILNFPDYEVSLAGRVRSLPRKGVPVGRVLKQTNRDLYNEVHLGRGILRRVHRLVAEAFLPREEGRDYVDHINRDKTDNRVENLRWVTCGENHMNKGAQSNSKSGHKNIHWKSDKGKWRVEIQGLHRGYYLTLDEAIAGRDEILSR